MKVRIEDHPYARIQDYFDQVADKIKAVKVCPCQPSLYRSLRSLPILLSFAGSRWQDAGALHGRSVSLGVSGDDLSGEVRAHDTATSLPLRSLVATGDPTECRFLEADGRLRETTSRFVSFNQKLKICQIEVFPPAQYVNLPFEIV